MNHAILGAGGIGGLMAAALVHAGQDATLILRPEALSQHPDRLRLKSPYGNLEFPIERTTSLDRHFDVVWLTVKATQLDGALQTLSAGRDKFDFVVPLLNGVDHVDRLRSLFGHDRVIPATISVESERISPGDIAHRSPFCRLAVSSSGKQKLGGILQKLTDFGFTCEFVDDEITLLWRKLIFLAPLALTSSASGLATDGMRSDPEWHVRLHAAIREAGTVALAEGAKVDVDGIAKTIDGLPAGMKSSMQKDVDAGRRPELDAIGGPIVRGGRKHGVPTPVVEELMALVQERAQS